MKSDADEKELLESVERGEWKSAGGGKKEQTRYTPYAKATFRKEPSAEHAAIEQGFGGHSGARAR